MTLEEYISVHSTPENEVLQAIKAEHREHEQDPLPEQLRAGPLVRRVVPTQAPQEKERSDRHDARDEQCKQCSHAFPPLPRVPTHSRP